MATTGNALIAEFDCVVVEGAGSPAEINLRDRDIANMGFAEAADVPVILIAGSTAAACSPISSARWNCCPTPSGPRQGLRHQPFPRRHRAPAIRASTGSRRRTGKVSSACPTCTG